MPILTIMYFVLILNFWHGSDCKHVMFISGYLTVSIIKLIMVCFFNSPLLIALSSALVVICTTSVCILVALVTRHPG